MLCAFSQPVLCIISFLLLQQVVLLLAVAEAAQQVRAAVPCCLCAFEAGNACIEVQ